MRDFYSVSVIVTVYNSSEYLNYCLNSLEMQSLIGMEIVIVIDGSEDKNDYLISENFKKTSKHSVVIIANDKNIGTAKSRKLGIDVARAEYIGFLDADDYVHPECFLTLYTLATQNSSDIVVSNYEKSNVWNLDNFSNLPKSYAIEHMEGWELFENQMLRVDRPFYLRVDWWNKIYKKELFLKYDIDFPAVVRNEGVLSMLYSLQATRCLIVDLKLFVTTTRPDSVCRSYKKKNIDDIIESTAFFRRHLHKKNLLKKYYSNYIRLMIYVVFDHNIQMIIKNLDSKSRNGHLDYLVEQIKSNSEIYEDFVFYIGLRDKKAQLLAYTTIANKKYNWLILKELKNSQFFDRRVLMKQPFIRSNRVFKPDVTIVTICKDIIQSGRKEFFLRMVDSVSEQKFQGKIEHLVLDANSTDGTFELLTNLFEKNKLTTVYSEPDSGIYNAMNKAAMLAKGKYILFLNSDDFLDGYAISTLYDLISSCNVDYVCADAFKVNENEQPVGSHKANLDKIFFGVPYCHQTLLCKKSVFRDIYFDESYKITMWKFALDLHKHFCGVSIPKKLAYFRVGGISTNDNFATLFKDEQLRIKKDIADQLDIPIDVYMYLESLVRQTKFNSAYDNSYITNLFIDDNNDFKMQFFKSFLRLTNLNFHSN